MITNKLTLYLLSICSLITGFVLLVSGVVSLAHILTAINPVLLSAGSLIIFIDAGTVLIMVLALFGCVTLERRKKKVVFMRRKKVEMNSISS